MVTPALDDPGSDVSSAHVSSSDSSSSDSSTSGIANPDGRPGDGECGDCASEVARRGRPRTAGVRDAILAATLDMVGEVGFRGFSMDELAQRAGVSKATIYRRWDSKESLVLDALHSAIGPLDDVDLGSVVADLEAYLTDMARRMTKGHVSDLLPHLIDVSVHDAQLRASLDDYVTSRRRPLRAILERGRERGEIRDDVDLDVVVDTLSGPFVYRKLLRYANFEDDFADRLLAVVLPGIVTAS